MPQPFNIIFHDSLGNETQTKGEIQDNDWNMLLSFRASAFRLQQCGVIKKRTNISYEFASDEKEGLSVKSEAPSIDEFWALLHVMRPFILQKEPTYFFNVCGVLTKYISHEIFSKFIKKQRSLFSGKDFQSQIQIDIGGVTLNSDSVLTKWLNAYEYHQEPDKKEEIDLLHSSLPLEHSRAIFASMLIDKAKAIVEISRIVTGMEKRDNQAHAFSI